MSEPYLADHCMDDRLISPTRSGNCTTSIWSTHSLCQANIHVVRNGCWVRGKSGTILCDQLRSVLDKVNIVIAAETAHERANLYSAFQLANMLRVGIDPLTAVTLDRVVRFILGSSPAVSCVVNPATSDMYRSELSQSTPEAAPPCVVGRVSRPGRHFVWQPKRPSFEDLRFHSMASIVVLLKH